MEQEAGHFLAAQLASEHLGHVLRLRNCRDDIQVTDAAAVAGGRKDPGELEADAVVGSTLASAGQTV